MTRLICGFIGLGLIGGSIAKALRSAFPDMEIIAYDISQEALSLATREGVVDRAAPAIDQSFSRCDYIFLCAPVQRNDGNLDAVRRIMGQDCLLTDVGSVKTPIHEAVHAAGLDDRFIGGHPMAGSERVGYANSRITLLENAYYILTPAPAVGKEKLEAFRRLVAAMGAIPLILDCQRHDYITAAISHLPHIVAASLVNLVRNRDSEDGLMKLVAAGGFKDITRIASSSALMWQQICLANTENISSLLEDYIRCLTLFREELDSRCSSALYDEFENARVYRNSFIGAPSGPIKRSYGMNVDIADRSGALAHITALLAEQEISIKNIGIVHNRESEDGVLRLEFYDDASLQKSAHILNAAGYAANIRG